MEIQMKNTDDVCRHYAITDNEQRKHFALKNFCQYILTIIRKRKMCWRCHFLRRSFVKWSIMRVKLRNSTGNKVKSEKNMKNKRKIYKNECSDRIFFYYFDAFFKKQKPSNG